MPDVGSVSIHVDIDASDLGDKIAAAVQRAVLPAIAKAQRHIGDLNKNLGDVDDAGLRKAATHIDNIATSAKRAATSTKEAHRGAVDLGRTVRAMDDSGMRKVARAADRVTDSMKRSETAAKSASTSWMTEPRDARGRWTRRGGGGGPPRAPRGGRRGGGGEDYSGIIGQVNLQFDRFVAKAILVSSAISTLTPIIGLLAGAVGVLGGGIGVVVGGLGQLSSGLAAVVPAILGIVAAVKIGFSGLKEGAKAYMKQFEDANKVVAAQIGNMMGPMLTAWQEVSTRIKLDFAQAMVPAFNNLGQLIRNIGPSLSEVGQAFGQVAGNVTAGLLAATPAINQILAGSKTFLTAIGPGITNLAAGFLNMGAAAQQAMPAIGAAVRGAFDQIAAAMNQVAASPEFQTALQGFAQIITSIGTLLASLGPTLTQLGAMIGPMFAQLIDALGPILNELLLVFGQLAQQVGPIFISFLQQLAPAINAVLLGLGQIATAVGPTLGPMFTALGQALLYFVEPLSTLGKILGEQLTAILPTIGQALAGLVGPIAQALPTVGSLIKIIADLVIQIQPFLTEVFSVVGEILNKLMQIIQPLLPVFGALANALTPVLDVIGNVLVTSLTGLGKVIELLAPNVETFFTMLADMFVSIQPALNDFVQQFGQILPELIDQAMPILREMFEQTRPAVEQLLNAFVQMLPSMLQLAEVGIQALIVAMPLLITPLKVFAEVLDVLQPLIEGFVLVVTGLADAITTVFTDIATGLVGPINWIIDQYNNKLRPLIEAARTIAPWIPSPPTIEHISPPTLGGGGTFGGGGGATTATGPTVTPSLTPGGAGGPAPQTWAGAGAYTPVSPDLGKGTTGEKGAKGLSAEDMPLDVIAKSPEQIKLLNEIRDLLAGTGNSGAPLNTLKDLKSSVSTISKDLKKTLPEEALPPGAVPGGIGPFGTPYKARHPGYEFASAMLSEFGLNPETYLGQNPIDYATEQWQTTVDNWTERTNQRIDQLFPTGAAGTTTGGTITGATTALNWTALAQAEAGGNWAANTGNGYFGGLQFDQATWDQYKPAGAPAQAWQATREQQIQAAENAIKARGGPQTLWPTNWQKLYEGTNITPGTVPGATTGGLGTGATASNPVPVWVVGMGPTVGTGLTGGTGGWWGTGIPSVLKDTGPVPSGPNARQAAALIQGRWPQITNIGGSRTTGAEGTHNAGRAIDIMIPGYETAQGVQLGNQIRDFLQQNAQMLGVVYTIWQNQGLNTGLGGRAAGTTFGATGHMDHIDVQFTDGSVATLGTGAGLTGGLTSTGGTVPVFVTNWPGQQAQLTGAQMPQQVKDIVGAGITAGGQVASNVASDVLTAAGGVGLEPWVERKPQATTEALVQEGNPLALASMAGFNVQTFARFGGGAQVEEGPSYDASGRLFSDTGALIARTMTGIAAQIDAMRQQLLDVLNQVRDRLTREFLLPIMQEAVTAGFEAIKSSVMADWGKVMGEAAAPPIATAVQSEVQSQNNTVGQVVTDAGNVAMSTLFDSGGTWESGTAGLNMSGATERVLSPSQTALFDAGLLGGWNLPSTQFATVSGVIGNKTVGAEFFGVSQIPIIALIINLLVRVLLEVLGVQIEVRDTLGELSQNFRSFRGDAFKVFDAQGRLLSDTSGLIDRSLSSEKAVADERIRILKIVIAALIKYIIEKVIVPIAKAVANTAINAAASAAGTAVKAGITAGAAAGGGGGAAGGAIVGDIAGNLVSTAISSAGQAAVDIIAEVATDFGLALTDVLVDVFFTSIQTALPGTTMNLFSGWWTGVLLDPLGKILSLAVGASLQSILGPASNLIGTAALAAGGAATGGIIGSLLSMLMVLTGGGFLGGGWTTMGLLGGGMFDNGGMAYGPGLLAKSTLSPERVLSPRQTTAFERFVDALESGGGLGARNTTIHAPFTVVGGQTAGQQAHDKLLALMS